MHHCSSLLQRTVDSVNLLQGLSNRDESARHEAAVTIQRIFDSWYFGFGSPAVAGFLETVANDTGGATLDTSMHGLITEQIPDLLRILHTAPSSDIRSAARDILRDLKIQKGFKIPNTVTSSPSFIQSLNTYILFREYWFQWGRLNNYINVMGYHPEYLECYMKLKDHLFRGDLPLPYPDRYYIAIIDDIYNLTHGGDSNPLKEALSLSELMHVVAILSHVHALACFIFGCGIRPEIDNYDGLINLNVDNCNEAYIYNNQTSNGSFQNNLHSSENGSTCSCLVEPWDDHTSENGNVNNQDSHNDEPSDVDGKLKASKLLKIIQTEDSSWEDVAEDIVAEQFLTAIISNSQCGWYLTQLSIGINTPQYQEQGSINPQILVDSEAVFPSNNMMKHIEKLSYHPLISRFLDSPQSGYKNFDARPFHATEYSWQEEGLPLADRLCTELGSLLDEKFRNAYDLTYNTLNGIQNVDTSLYRRTVWNEVQSFFGICHDDFRYDRVNRLLTTSQRAYLKLCSTFPVAVYTIQNLKFENIFPALSSSEMIHVILMIIEARQQACLSYILRAVSQCQVRNN
ncbi:sestrin 1/3 [Schistosoma bovis]|uniref:Sestrin 1/3 n=1 Tax=Schistosoma bovis TaxID=6184 RepID=A0A430QPE2_SCHBO|nr:sestrin 1/3 [Schistosoma bovis]